MKNINVKIIGTLAAFLMMSAQLSAFQDSDATPKMSFKFSPDSLHLKVGESTSVRVSLVDESGKLQKMSFFIFPTGPNARRSVGVDPNQSSDSTGTIVTNVKAHRPGTFNLMGFAFTSDQKRIQNSIPVDVAFPPLDKITFIEPNTKIYTGTSIACKTQVYDKAGLMRKEIRPTLESSNHDIATIDGLGFLSATNPGRVQLIAKADGIEERLNIQVVRNPVVSLKITSDMREARTGDVIHFDAIATDRLGKSVEDAPVYYSITSNPDDPRGTAATGLINSDGRFVAEESGLYTIVARSGPYHDLMTVKIEPRNVQQRIELVGHGEVLSVRTSDLWVWEGIDGKDYAVTGTWGANGEAYFWDVTDPSKMTIIDTVTVDARTVNDVKVSEDGRVGVISREGASNRKNGLVILDISNPRDVKILSRFDDGLTGGVHNVFIYNKHVYAVNNGQKYDIINIEDPKKPYRVSRFELDTPGHSIHDVWIEDGIAYSSNWQDGLQLVDIGSTSDGGPFKRYEETGIPEIKSPFYAGGSPSNPVQFASYQYPSGWNHAAFPFHSKSVNKFYVLAGDEAFPYGFDLSKPVKAAGWIHFVDFTNPANSTEVASYRVPEAGSHNLWVEDDKLYAAFYNGGLRVVDISGELMGDLYRQGREIAWYLPSHPEGVVANAPMVWGPMPFKGNIFFSDFHTGLWAVRLVPKKELSGTQ